MTNANNNMQHENDNHERALPGLDFTTTECSDGLICENSSSCIPHPLKEGSYMCDCTAANGGADSIVKFAGVYCEHSATSYCQEGADESAHAFCTNDGTCKLMVGKKEEHAGCKCPKGYTGSYCQFVQGSMPSDWTLDNYMHPALVNAYATNDDKDDMTGILIGAGVGLGVVALILVTYLFCGFQDLKAKLKRNEKEMDTASENNGSIRDIGMGGRRASAAASPSAPSEFVGGQSVYKKKTSTGHFVTGDTLDADGGVLTDAMQDHNEPMPDTGVASESDATPFDAAGEVKEGTSMEEVDLDELPSSLENKGEMA